MGCVEHGYPMIFFLSGGVGEYVNSVSEKSRSDVMEPIINNIIWKTKWLMVETDIDGDLIMTEKPGECTDMIFVPYAEMEEFCRHYLSLIESKE